MQNYQTFHFPIQDMYLSGKPFSTIDHPGEDMASLSGDRRLFHILDGQFKREFYDNQGGNIVEFLYDFIDGRRVLVRHGHLEKLTNYPAGKRVSGGEEFGRYGTSGNTTGPHDHAQIDLGEGWIPFRLGLDIIRLTYENRRPYLEFHEAFNHHTPSDQDIANFIQNGTDWRGEFSRVGHEKQCQI